jgi:hypothetical protein
MTIKRALIGLAIVACLAGAAYFVAKPEGTGPRMTDAASKFVASLTADQKKKALIDFDSKERTRWFFTPQQKAGKSLRKGLPLVEMTADQRKLALALVQTGTSKAGYEKATAIMDLENVLKSYEKGKGPVRNDKWYFFSIFGEPSKTGKWGWRCEGHHLSINYTMEGTEVVSATPAVFGANPAELMAGPKKGFRALPESMDGFTLLAESLDKEQTKVARLAKLHPEIKEAEAKPSLKGPDGLAAEKMTEKQKAALWKLIEGYAARLPDDVAAAELTKAKKAGVDKVYFSYAVDEKRKGKPNTYRVQGPTFVIEYLNEQGDAAGNPANHIHSAWRNMKGDFGLAK